MLLIELNFGALILAFGALQGYFLAAILYRHQRGNQIANRCLASLLLIISIQLTDTCLAISGVMQKWPHMINVTRPLWFLIAPLLYLYIRQLIPSASKFSKKDFLHLLPALVSALSLIRFYPLSGQQKLAWVKALYQLNEPSGLMLFFWNFYTVQLLVYVWISSYLLKRWREINMGENNGFVAVDFSWLQRLLQIFAIYLAFSFLTILSLTIAGNYLPMVDYLSICTLTIFIHATAIIAIGQPEKMFPVLQRLRQKYQHSALSETDREKLVLRLKSMMQNEQPFLDRDLKLKDLADRLNIPGHHLSQILNQELASSFYDFINNYRVKEAKNRLSDPACQHLTIEAISSDVGFKSRASFYRIFKKATGKTPTEFIHWQKGET